MPSNVIERFRHLFGQDPSAMVSGDFPSKGDEAKALEEQRIAAIRDARTAVGTEFYKEFRRRLRHEIKVSAPDPMMGSDVAMCMTFKREGLMRSEEILDLLVRLAEEKIPNE